MGECYRDSAGAADDEVRELREFGAGAAERRERIECACALLRGRALGAIKSEQTGVGRFVAGRIGAGDLADATKQNWFGRFFGWASPI